MTYNDFKNELKVNDVKCKKDQLEALNKSSNLKGYLEGRYKEYDEFVVNNNVKKRGGKDERK